jgi:hypothetical protein
MLNRYSFIDVQKLLISPSERVNFIFLYILVTTFSSIASHIITKQKAFIHLWNHSYIQYGIASGIIIGAFIGAFQWLALRKYIPSTKWIVIVCLTTVCFSCLSAITRHLTYQNINYQNIYTNSFVFKILVFNIIQLVMLLMSGYLQAYVLRPYVIDATLWVGVPLFGAICNQVIFTANMIFYQFYHYIFWDFRHTISSTFNVGIIQSICSSAIQAFCFCLFYKKSHEDDRPIFPFALAPDIHKYLDIMSLSRILRSSIDSSWVNDFPPSIDSLKYLVGVNNKGKVIAFEPINSAAIENVELTPLPNLVNRTSLSNFATENQVPLAKFEVVFSSPGSLTIKSCRGIPLIWLSIGTLISSIVITKLLTFIIFVIFHIYFI